MHDNHLTEADKALLRDTFAGGGFSIIGAPPYEPVAMAWLNGRRVTDWPDPGVDTSTPPYTFADGFEYVPPPVPRSPQGYPLGPPPAPSRKVWDALVAEHGLNPAHFVRNRPVEVAVDAPVRRFAYENRCPNCGRYTNHQS